jgi:hypothetical protein
MPLGFMVSALNALLSYHRNRSLEMRKMFGSVILRREEGHVDI